MKIVIAVPDPSLREALMQRLRKRLSNDALEVAYDGRTLLDAVVTLRPQIVVMDTLLPEIDGLSVFHELRQLPENCQPEVVLLSSLSSEAILRKLRGYSLLILRPYHAMSDIWLSVFYCAAENRYGSSWSPAAVWKRRSPSACTIWDWPHAPRDICTLVKPFCGSVTNPAWPTP